MSKIVMRYRMVTAAVRSRGVRPIHIQPVETWTDPSEGYQEKDFTFALCGVRAGENYNKGRGDRPQVLPADATCRRCRQLWKAAMAEADGSAEAALKEALDLIDESLGEWEEAGALDYVLPSEPRGHWRVGVLQGTSCDPQPFIIALDTIEEATAFLAGAKAIGEWSVRTRRQGAW